MNKRKSYHDTWLFTAFFGPFSVRILCCKLVVMDLFLPWSITDELKEPVYQKCIFY